MADSERNGYAVSDSGFAPTAYEDLVREHPEVVCGQSDRDPSNNNEALNDLSRPLHPRR